MAMEEKKDTAKRFFDWAFEKRADFVLQRAEMERRQAAGGGMKKPEMSAMDPKMAEMMKEAGMNQMKLAFCSHEPAFISYGPAGLNASVKGVGFMPKPEYLEETLNAYYEHIKTFQRGDETYSARGLEVLVKYMYGPENRHRVDLTCLGSLEMARKHSYANYKVNSEAVLLFHEPSDISYELRGKVTLYDEKETGEVSLYQQLLNAQHDVYHYPGSEDFEVNLRRYHTMPAYVFQIEEIYDNSSRSPYGRCFGTKLEFPYEGM